MKARLRGNNTQVARFVEGHRGVKLAVTVLLVRDGVHCLEVYVQERVSSMPTFPKATVFPGGGIDPRDFAIAQPQTGKPDEPLVFEPNDHESFDSDPTWYGPRLSVWADRLKTDRFRARALIMGACRELFEESGTLLASHADGRSVTDATPYHNERLALESHHLSFSQMLLQNNLVARTDLLAPCSRWISPETDKHQFDLYSFVALPPYGQEPDGRTSEAASTGWFTPSIVLDGWRAGLIRLVIPTWAHMLMLSEHKTVKSLLYSLKNPSMEPVVGDPSSDPRYREFYNFTPPKRF
ncbi:MAG: NUDIX hydrolase [Corynebacterium sp.]|nr:NUDIX hydrolase [Corynebacterium sp.]